VTGAIALLGALRAGWNDPRPATPPDWQAGAPHILSASAEAARAIDLLERPPGAFTFEAVATVQSGADFNGYGLVFHAQDAAHYTAFAVGSDGYLSVLTVSGEEETELLAWQAFPHIRRGAGPNRLRVSCAEGTCRFWINDEVVAALPDEGGGGEVGLWVRWYEGARVVVEFSNVATW
jgi:hypothetical protein